MMNDTSRPGSSATAADKDALIQVSDMTCGHCIGAIKAALEESLPGTPYTIDLERKRVTVPASNEAAACDAIRAAGYTPVRIGR
jgi:copper chaperone